MTEQVTIWPRWYHVRADVVEALGMQRVRFLVDLLRQSGPGHYLIGELLVTVEDQPIGLPRSRPCRSRHWRGRSRGRRRS